jgi:hypothetical protein
MGLRSWKISSIFSVLALLCLLGMQAFAQTTTVAGEVTDPQQAVIGGTQVKLTDVSTKQVLTTTTNDSGRYIFAGIPSGTYSITFTKAGFSTKRIDNQHVDVGLGLTLNAVLEVGSTSTVVEVTSVAGAELQTMNSTVSGTVAGDSLTLLPNFTREASAASRAPFTIRTCSVLTAATTRTTWTAV